ncbi:MAG: hypothetical protein ACQESQ_12970 [Bacteroidota bacterium]
MKPETRNPKPETRHPKQLFEPFVDLFFVEFHEFIIIYWVAYQDDLVVGV